MGVLGADGDAGAVAGFMTDNATGEVPPDFGFSSDSTALIKLLPTAWAMACACIGDRSTTEMLIKTVLASDVALTLPASWSGVTPRPRESIAGWSTMGEPT